MPTRRKLAAILSADATGYSRLMADDEAATLRSLNDARSLFRKRIEAHGGRLIDTAGDSVLTEFPSAVEAVDCAIENAFCVDHDGPLHTLTMGQKPRQRVKGTRFSPSRARRGLMITCFRGLRASTRRARAISPRVSRLGASRSRQESQRGF